MEITAVYKDAGQFMKPTSENVRIWRYIDFRKFVYMLDQSCLFFCRGDKLQDRYEGSLLPYGIFKSETDKWRIFIENMRKFRSTVTVNCWHMNEHESAAMWSIYSNGGTGIAIQSTFKNLAASFNTYPNDVNIGVVKYLDYQTEEFADDNPDVFTPFLHKRLSFSHEQELRAIIWAVENVSGKTTEGDVRASVNLDVLVNGIFISPESPQWVEELVRSIAKKYVPEAPVFQSGIDGSPLY